jgi:hypothetical protein
MEFVIALPINFELIIPNLDYLERGLKMSLPVDKYDTYILGEKDLEKAPFMKKINYDVSTINGRSIKSIANEVQGMLKKERNQWTPYLTRRAYYATTAAAIVGLFGLTAACLSQSGLIATKISPQLTNRINIYGSISAALSSLFYFFQKLQSVNIRTKVALEWHEKHPEWQPLQGLFQKALNQLEPLLEVSKRSQDLLTSITDKEQRKKIRTFNSRIFNVCKEVKSNVQAMLKAVHQLPADVRHVLR